MVETCSVARAVLPLCGGEAVSRSPPPLMPMLVVHPSNLVERDVRARLLENAEVRRDHRWRDLRDGISWLSERLLAGAERTARVRASRKSAGTRRACGWPRAAAASACSVARTRLAASAVRRGLC